MKVFFFGGGGQKWHCTVNYTNNHTCILVFTTSMGVFPNTEQAPANAPNTPVTSVGIGFLGSPPLYRSLHVSITKNRIAWLLPCFSIVAVRPLYRPPKPDKQKSNNFYHCTVHSDIQGDSGGICITLGNDSMSDSKQKNSYEHGSDFERLRSYGHFLIPVHALM